MIFYSHIKHDSKNIIIPGSEILLVDHLSNIAGNIKAEIQSTIFDESLNKTFLTDIGFLIGITHDFGKYTTFFQKKLLNKQVAFPEANHGLISALFCFYCLQEYHICYNYLESLKFFYINQSLGSDHQNV